jgi:hypothetical protein
MESITGYIGRNHELEQAVTALRSGASIIVKGRAGIGKSAFLRQVYQRLSSEKPCIWVPDRNLKAMTFEIAEQVHHLVSLKVPERYIPQRHRSHAYQTGQVSWEVIKRTISRAPSIDVMQLVFESLQGKGVIVFIDSLEVPPSQAEIFQDLGDVAQLAAGLSDENRRVRIQKLLWKFQETIELGPLRKDQVVFLTESWLENKDIYFSSNNIRESYIRAVVQDSGAIPAAIKGMLTAATNDGEVTRASVRSYRHEIGTRYFDMMPVVIIGALGFMAMRYISRGIGVVELYVLSGVATVLFYGLTYMLRKLGK